ncbi:MAG: TMEM165/GDT1 family protein [Candidatus Nanohaloarchaea archaeon]|nr:TMEM165/GDT1 family protein [Candidatus Nanohaloarchaea archaeon]
MADPFHLVVLAFSLQLLSLPGEKGQVVISTLAARYPPWQVVAGASAAFGGWTVVELLVGGALSEAVPPVYVDAVFVAMLLSFSAWMLYRSGREPGEPGTPAWEEVFPGRVRGLASSFTLTGVGEFGDKTQIITFGLAAKYGPHPSIWVGEMLAIVPVTAANAYLVDRASGAFDKRWVYLVSAFLLLVIAMDVVSTYLLGSSFLPP